MKRSSQGLKRKTPLKRTRSRTSPGRKASTRTTTSRSKDPAYLAQVRGLGCYLFMDPVSTCFGPIDAHHAGRKGVGQKCSDYETHGFCRKHHDAWHSHNDLFKGWTRDERRLFANIAIAFTQYSLGRVP